jgi:hypothetical protein
LAEQRSKGICIGDARPSMPSRGSGYEVRSRNMPTRDPAESSTPSGTKMFSKSLKQLFADGIRQTLDVSAMYMRRTDKARPKMPSRRCKKY